MDSDANALIADTEAKGTDSLSPRLRQAAIVIERSAANASPLDARVTLMLSAELMVKAADEIDALNEECAVSMSEIHNLRSELDAEMPT